VIHAVWSTSYVPLIAVVIVGLAVVAGFLFWRKRKGPAPEKKPTPSAGGAEAEGVKCASCGTENLADQKFCTNCGEKLPKPGKHHT
jgi:hypothetical protein